MKSYTNLIALTFLFLFIGIVFCRTSSGQHNPLIESVSAPCFQTGHPPTNVLDGNNHTVFLVHPYGSCGSSPNMELNMVLSKTVKALQVTIVAGVSGIIISPGTIPNYHTTLETTETLYIIIPAGFSTIQFFKTGWGSISRIEIEELNLDLISLPFHYDAAGNMTQRTIVLGATKGSMVNAPELAQYHGNTKEPHITEQMYPFGHVLIYPNPTRGELRIETKFNDTTLTNGLITVYSLNGARILQRTFNSEIKTISIADQPSGLYILTLSVNGKTHRWNVIKE